MEVMWIADPLLCAVIVQLMGICWAISLVRQLEFLLNKNNKMSIDKHLSIQVFPKKLFLWSDGGVKSNDSFIYLKEFGVLLEEECILDQPEHVNGSVDSVSDRRLRYHPEDLDVFNLENLLYNRGDEAYGEFHSSIQNLLRGEGVRLFQFVYLAMIAILEPMPNPVERTFTPQPLASWVVLSPMMDITCLLLELLVIVMASSSIQCQDSYMPDFADNGYSLIYADLVTEYVEMTVGENTAYY
ncbi:hypothetical protein HID58_083611 [Brassica napus]|uniref:DUF4220 domain-containing protein n=1 Tax=Brassica napus TaxID=3708 RepID=A0ABQ7YGY5_BRANA|nr:hypothetical protein HID58_083611 [Brassica napus]